MANKYKSEKKNELSDEPRSVRQCTHSQRKRRQESAQRCAKARAKRTDQEQLDRLNKLLGKNKGAKKERARIENKVKSKNLKKKDKINLKESGR
jgi:hypothetical protein